MVRTISIALAITLAVAISVRSGVRRSWSIIVILRIRR